MLLDESSPVVQRLAATYRIELATPDLTGFVFDLKFTARPAGPPPVALMPALRAVGYQGPEVVKLAQVGMYLLTIEPAVPAFVKYFWNVDLGPFPIPDNTWLNFPMNSTLGIPTTSDVTRVTNGEFYVTRPGIYQFTGSICFAENTGYQRLALTVNTPSPDGLPWFRFDSRVAEGVNTESFVFIFTEHITPQQIAANTTGAIVRVLLWSSAATSLLGSGVVNWMTVARLT